MGRCMFASNHVIVSVDECRVTNTFARGCVQDGVVGKPDRGTDYKHVTTRGNRYLLNVNPVPYTGGLRVVDII